MALIRPFKGYRYAAPNTDISTYCAPPYDVLTEKDRVARSQVNPHTVVNLELAPGAEDLETPGNRYVTAKATWDEWCADGTLKRDDTPAYYLLEQRFTINGIAHNRMSFIAEAQLHAFSEKIILPHERTLPKALGDRYRLTKTTNVNFSQVFGLFSEPGEEYFALVRECAAQEPIANATETDGTMDVLWNITDSILVNRITRMLEDKQVFIADGHHRYTTALAWRDECREALYGCKAEEAPGREDFNADAGSEYAMMALSNMDDPQLIVLPYHRAAAMDEAHSMDEEGLAEALSTNFDVSTEFPTYPLAEQSLAAADAPAFLFDMGSGPRQATLKSTVRLTDFMDSAHCEQWMNLDVTVLQYLVMAPILGIASNDPESLKRLSFDCDKNALIEGMTRGESDVVFVMRATRMDQLRSVSLNGETMPQKSTYFYPKLPSGLVFRTIA